MEVFKFEKFIDVPQTITKKENFIVSVYQKFNRKYFEHLRKIKNLLKSPII